MDPGDYTADTGSGAGFRMYCSVNTEIVDSPMKMGSLLAFFMERYVNDIRISDDSKDKDSAMGKLLIGLFAELKDRGVKGLDVVKLSELH